MTPQALGAGAGAARCHAPTVSDIADRLSDLKTAAVSTGVLTLKRRSPCLVTRDQATGSWRHRYRQGVLVNDWPRGATWKKCRDVTYGLFLARYTPKAGDVVVELGAGVGTETVFLSQLVGPTGRVIACEASPRAAELLSATASANGMTNIEVFQAAIMDQAGSITLLERDGASGVGNSVYGAGGEMGSVEVPAWSLDDLVSQHGLDRIDFLKVNIEGAEQRMLDGMEQTLPKLRNAVISCHDFIADKIGNDTFRTRQKVSTFFAEHGFDVEFHAEVPGKPWLRDYLYVKPR